MTKPILTKLVLVGATAALAVSLLPNSPAKAEPEEGIKFICSQGYDRASQKRLPTTYAWYQGNKHGIIRWVKALGSSNPQDRCEQVSPRFQTAYDNGSLNIIMNGTKNGQPVICTTRKYGGECDTLLMTLRPGDNAIAFLNDLKDALNGRGIGPIKHSSGIPQMYYQIDLKETLRNTPAE